MKTIVFAFIGSALGTVGGLYAYSRFKNKMKCSCNDTAKVPAPPAATEKVPESQPISATAAVAMNADGWSGWY